MTKTHDIKNERLAEGGRYRSDYAESDRQHLAILRIVQVARARHDADQT